MQWLYFELALKINTFMHNIFCDINTPPLNHLVSVSMSFTSRLKLISKSCQIRFKHWEVSHVSVLSLMHSNPFCGSSNTDKGSFSLAFSEVPIMHYLAECYPHAPLIFHNKTQLSTLLCCMHKKELLAFQLRLGRTITVANYFTDFSIPTLFSQKWRGFICTSVIYWEVCAPIARTPPKILQHATVYVLHINFSTAVNMSHR